MRAKNFGSLLVYAAAILMLTACIEIFENSAGSGAGENGETDGGTIGGVVVGGDRGEASTRQPWYISTRAVDEAGRQSPYSNEVQGDFLANETVTLAWGAPNMALDGTCTTINGYEIQMGGTPGVYTHAITVHSNFAGLSCAATGVNACGNTYTCEVDVAVPSS